MQEPETNTTPAPYAAGTGSVPVTPDRAAFDRMGYRERLALKREDPPVTPPCAPIPDRAPLNHYRKEAIYG